MKLEKIFYILLRIVIFPLSFLPYKTIHSLGKKLGLIAYYLCKSYRKRTLANIALAKDLNLTPEEIQTTAKKSFQNLAINLLEYAKFSEEKDFSKIIRCENPQLADEIYAQGKGILFFCGHEANFEALFLDGTSRMKGVAIGRPIKNGSLYRWILKIREKNGGTMITPKNALKEGLKALQAGKFLGIVGDQGMPGTHYSFPFLGRRAWNTTAPALLSYKTNTPIIVASTRREKGKYIIHYSDPIYPDLTQPKEEEIRKMMDLSLTYLQNSIRKNPSQYLWQHNRYKQQTPRHIPKEFRFESVAIILPDEKKLFTSLANAIKTFRRIYFSDFLFLFVPEKYKTFDFSDLDAEEIFYYQKKEDLLRKDFRFKIVYNFSRHPEIKKHYEKLSAFTVLSYEDLKRIAQRKEREENFSSLEKDPSNIFLKAILRDDSPIHNLSYQDSSETP
jgi:Kdo2-lipid IVA lauroyltransferase/acyltransferase